MMSTRGVTAVSVLNKDIPMYYSAHILSPETVGKAMKSKPFLEWVENIELRM